MCRHFSINRDKFSSEHSPGNSMEQHIPTTASFQTKEISWPGAFKSRLWIPALWPVYMALAVAGFLLQESSLLLQDSLLLQTPCYCRLPCYFGLPAVAGFPAVAGLSAVVHRLTYSSGLPWLVKESLILWGIPDGASTFLLGSLLLLESLL